MNGYLNVITKNNVTQLGSLVLPLFITACHSTIPTQVEFQQQTYQLTHSQNLGKMAHFVYTPQQTELASTKELKRPEQILDWFIDSQYISTQQRVNIRQDFYQKHHPKWVSFSYSPQQINSIVIYQPTPQLPYWQMDISLGKNLKSCGFNQWQYTVKNQSSNLLELLKQSKGILKELQSEGLVWGCE